MYMYIKQDSCFTTSSVHKKDTLYIKSLHIHNGHIVSEISREPYSVCVDMVKLEN